MHCEEFISLTLPEDIKAAVNMTLPAVPHHGVGQPLSPTTWQRLGSENLLPLPGKWSSVAASCLEGTSEVHARSCQDSSV